MNYRPFSKKRYRRKRGRNAKNFSRKRMSMSLRCTMLWGLPSHLRRKLENSSAVLFWLFTCKEILRAQYVNVSPTRQSNALPNGGLSAALTNSATASIFSPNRTGARFYAHFMSEKRRLIINEENIINSFNLNFYA